MHRARLAGALALCLHTACGITDSSCDDVSMSVNLDPVTLGMGQLQG